MPSGAAAKKAIPTLHFVRLQVAPHLMRLTLLLYTNRENPIGKPSWCRISLRCIGRSKRHCRSLELLKREDWIHLLAKLMVELSLWGSLIHNKLGITVRTLEAITGMTPRVLDEAVLVYEPKQPFRPTLSSGQVNQIEQYRIFARSRDAGPVAGDGSPFQTASDPLEHRGGPSHPIQFGGSETDLLKSQTWSLEIREVPEAGGLKVIQQQVFNTKIEEGDPLAVVEALGYAYKKQYWICGYEFVKKNVILSLFRIWTWDLETSAPALFDKSGAWTAKAWVDVRSMSDLAATEMGVNELVTFQQDLKDLLSLDPPSRPPFDTRIRSTA